MTRSTVLALMVFTISSAIRADEQAGTAQEPVEAKSAAVAFKQDDGGLQIFVGTQIIAEYVFKDDHILRPFFRHLKTPSGVQVTRTQPPVKGLDLDDHPTMHPGLWLAF